MRLDIRIEFDPPDLPQRLGTLARRLERHLGRAVMRGARMIQRVAHRRAPRDTGEFAGSIDVRLRGPLEAEVGSHLQHAAAIEFGSRPHMPPFEPIRLWVRRNRGKLGITARQVDRVARFVQRKIARVGTPEHRVLRGALEQVQGDIVREVEAAVRAGLEEELGGP